MEQLAHCNALMKKRRLEQTGTGNGGFLVKTPYVLPLSRDRQSNVVYAGASRGGQGPNRALRIATALNGTAGLIHSLSKATKSIEQAAWLKSCNRPACEAACVLVAKNLIKMSHLLSWAAACGDPKMHRGPAVPDRHASKSDWFSVVQRSSRLWRGKY